ncbi:OmpW family outer membrane protein, partial [Ralstonia solanacearum species complex bacterium RW470]
MAYKKALAAAAGMILATAAHAQSAGSNIVSLGWFRVMPNSSSDPLQIDSVGGVPLNRSVPNTGAKIKDADTLGLAFTHFFTDNLAVELVGGIPPRHKIEGTDSFARYGQIGSAKDGVQNSFRRTESSMRSRCSANAAAAGSNAAPYAARRGRLPPC